MSEYTGYYDGKRDRWVSPEEERADFERPSRPADSSRDDGAAPLVTAGTWECDGCHQDVTDGVTVGDRQLCDHCYRRGR